MMSPHPTPPPPPPSPPQIPAAADHSRHHRSTQGTSHHGASSRTNPTTSGDPNLRVAPVISGERTRQATEEKRIRSNEGKAGSGRISLKEPRIETSDLQVASSCPQKSWRTPGEGDEGEGRTMDWPPTPTSLMVRSPRQTVSLLHNRRRHRDPFPRSPSFAVGDHGPKPSEVYGFVGSITTVIATAIFLAWAYTPEPWLRSVGITYYPSKYWALVVPSFVIVAVALSMVIYMGFNFLATPPPTSFNTIFDENSRERVMFSPAMNEEERPIEPISDISIDQINNIVFGDR